MLEVWKKAVIHLECATDSEHIYDRIKKIHELREKLDKGEISLGASLLTPPRLRKQITDFFADEFSWLTGRPIVVARVTKVHNVQLVRWISFCVFRA